MTIREAHIQPGLRVVLLLSVGLLWPILVAAAPAPAVKPEQRVLSKIHETNQMEIKLGKLAQSKAGRQEVREYGERLARDHTVADTKVKELAKNEGYELIQPKPQTDEEKKIQEKQKQMAEKLAKLQGSEFDRLYLNAMVEGHTHAVETLREATKKLKDEDVQSLVKDLIPILEQHRELAQQLQKAPQAASASPQK